MKIDYLILRLIRHFLPEAAARFLLKRRWIIHPGLESSNPLAAAEQYINALSEHGRTINGARVLIFGYGGRFAVAAELLKHGAAHVVLCDHFVLLDEERNLELLPEYKSYLMLENNMVRPRPEFITLVHGDIREEAIQNKISGVDVVLSTSVFEHLEDVEGVTSALSKLTSPSGVNLHFIDLRDHFFRYPFEMLTFSTVVWKYFLNPTSNLNRYRLSDYQRVFEEHFDKANIIIVGRDEQAFDRVRNRIHHEFVSGDTMKDNVTLIRVFAKNK